MAESKIGADTCGHLGWSETSVVEGGTGMACVQGRGHKETDRMFSSPRVGMGHDPPNNQDQQADSSMNRSGCGTVSGRKKDDET